MFERLNTPDELYNYKLGAALKMEQTVLEMLEELQEEAQGDKVRQLLSHHHDETKQHIANLEQVFGVFGWDVDDSPCPAIEALQKEGKTNIKKTDDALVDKVILEGAVETEHHEIAVYENLIIGARSLGKDEAVRLLEENLEVEQHTLEEVRDSERQLSGVAA